MSDAAITGSPTSMSFTQTNWNVPRLFTVSAAQDGDNIDEAATFVLSSSGLPSVRVWVKAIDNDRPAGSPRASITLPRNADPCQEQKTEFFGDGLGSVVGAEFLVDGILRYTDVDSVGHYRFGGDHNLWNTTTLSNGQHVIMMRVFDNQGRSGSHSVSVNVSNWSMSPDASPTKAPPATSRCRIVTQNTRGLPCRKLGAPPRFLAPVVMSSSRVRRLEAMAEIRRWR